MVVLQSTVCNSQRGTIFGIYRATVAARVASGKSNVVDRQIAAINPKYVVLIIAINVIFRAFNRNFRCDLGKVSRQRNIYR